MWRLPGGACPRADGTTQFRVWAPQVRRLEVEVRGGDGARQALAQEDDGTFAGVAAAAPGDDYVYLLDGELARPDPVSRWQPFGVHGPSRVVDPGAFAWSDAGWAGLPLERYLIYELHVGTFTAAGTFDAVAERLDHLCALGVTAVELMPVAEFPGARNWGYDGVHLYAPHSVYGGPDGLKRLVDACHARGLAVVLDVVYNHLGPEGNYLQDYGPYFTDRYRTPWGAALNFDGPDSDAVRALVLDNARYWFSEHHFDALRLDAVHGIFDFGAHHILEELAATARAAAADLGRPCLLIAESDLNDARLLRPVAQGGLGMDAQWCDDFHRALHARLTGSRRGYFVDFGRVDQLARALTDGYVFQGQRSAYRRRRHGNASGDRPGRQFVVFAQNHDQIANACQGQRLCQVSGLRQARVATALVLSAPFLPLLFMGEEHAETAPFNYFTSHGDAALAAAVTRGRRREHAAFVGTEPFCDPQDEATFTAAKIDWSKPGRPPHRQHLAMVQALCALRREQAALGNCRKDLLRATSDEALGWIAVAREDPGGARALIVANLGAQEVDVPIAVHGAELQLVFWSEAQAWGGSGEPAPASPLSLPGEVHLTPCAVAIYAAPAPDRAQGRSP